NRRLRHSALTQQYHLDALALRRGNLPPQRSPQPPHLGFAAFDHLFPRIRWRSESHLGQQKQPAVPAAYLKNPRFKPLWRWYKLVRLSGREDLAKVVVAAGSREPAPLEPVHGTPKASPSADSPDCPSLHFRERNASMKNWKRESCTPETVRDEGGNILIYSASSAIRC